MNQRNVPGIDAAYLAMDTEEGVEVVWNEVMISERKNFKLLEVRPSVTLYLKMSIQENRSGILFSWILCASVGKHKWSYK